MEEKWTEYLPKSTSSCVQNGPGSREDISTIFTPCRGGLLAAVLKVEAITLTNFLLIQITNKTPKDSQITIEKLLKE